MSIADSAADLDDGRGTALVIGTLSVGFRGEMRDDRFLMPALAGEAKLVPLFLVQTLQKLLQRRMPAPASAFITNSLAHAKRTLAKRAKHFGMRHS